VRELQNALEYAALQAGDGELRLAHLPPDVRAAPSAPAPGPVDAADPGDGQRGALVAALERAGWNRTRAAAALGVSRVTLWKRMKRHGLGGPGPAEG
jgi:transcriptional regulator of acetoin/glycerol metabolism